MMAIATLTNTLAVLGMSLDIRVKSPSRELTLAQVLEHTCGESTNGISQAIFTQGPSLFMTSFGTGQACVRVTTNG